MPFFLEALEKLERGESSPAMNTEGMNEALGELPGHPDETLR
jgi:hypothetical protein